MLPFSLKHLGLTLGFAALMGATVAKAAEYDDKSAVIFAYFAVGNDDSPSSSIRTEQFAQQIAELTSGDYNILPLPRIVDAFIAGKTLPPRTVAITFDGADQSILRDAVPLLEDRDLPFTVFIPADRIESDKPPFMNWGDLRRLKRTGLASFGLHPASYSRLADSDADEIKRQINNSLALIRKELDVTPALFAYPYGEYDERYKKVVKALGFKAAFGQQSGVAWSGDDRYALPRFTLTERYADMDRFTMTANALPLPATDISPEDPHLKSLTPSIGFTVPEDMAKSLKSLSCFSSTEEKPELQILGSRVEIRMNKPFHEDRPRINCTMPVAGGAAEEPRFRWLGMMYTVPQDLLDAAAMAEQSKIQKHAGSANDSINME
jgi:peptidoglycan/xylan/chitin deacetylase (PgdA/CDA1 family)